MKDKRGFIKLIIFIIIILAIGFFYFVNQLDFSLKKEVNESEIKECYGKDCILTQITCCPCSAGGEEVCLSKEDSKYYNEKIKSCPKTLVCPQVYNCKIASCLEESTQ